MPLDSLSHFSERGGRVICNTQWGRWWQTVDEIHLEVELPPNTSSRNVVVKVTTNTIECQVLNNVIFQGKLFRPVHADETVWTIEDKKLLSVILSKAADPILKEEIWEALMEDGRYAPDAHTFHEMRKKYDLEKFQIENPGLDFSHAELAKCYDKIPGSTRESPEEEEEEEIEERTSHNETS